MVEALWPGLVLPEHLELVFVEGVMLLRAVVLIFCFSLSTIACVSSLLDHVNQYDVGNLRILSHAATCAKKSSDFLKNPGVGLEKREKHLKICT